MSRSVLCCGLTTLDITQVVERLPAANEKVLAGELRLAVGGPAANAALTAAALGSPTTLVTALGTGPLAALAHTALTEAGVRVLDLGTLDSPPVSTVLVTEATGERAVVSTNAATARELADLTGLAQLADGAACVLVDGHLPEASLALCRAAREHAIPTLLDGGSYKPQSLELFAHLDQVLLSEDFAWPGTTDALAAVATLGPQLVAQSAGGGPITVRRGGGTTTVPVTAVPPEEIVDTLGAGDVLHGAWAHAVAGGAGALEALRTAAEVASTSVRHPGALGWVRR
ncbi:PfkB family carbohydrate kinase [Ruania suaedae]|uniref:PfkB family carbohydrate kinase n=1 Tax=Ruania suaedae TaxID=2897774 RepID=UPI001E5EE7EA|nr:PfkB family carbohydrate kinase [Ruania suaedae]UFU04271.1 PfkB family carbohydrate kinase [Ruania suaedae]